MSFHETKAKIISIGKEINDMSRDTDRLTTAPMDTMVPEGVVNTPDGLCEKAAILEAHAADILPVTTELSPQDVIEKLGLEEGVDFRWGDGPSIVVAPIFDSLPERDGYNWGGRSYGGDSHYVEVGSRVSYAWDGPRPIVIPRELSADELISGYNPYRHEEDSQRVQKLLDDYTAYQGTLHPVRLEGSLFARGPYGPEREMSGDQGEANQHRVSPVLDMVGYDPEILAELLQWQSEHAEITAIENDRKIAALQELVDDYQDVLPVDVYALLKRGMIAKNADGTLHRDVADAFNWFIGQVDGLKQLRQEMERGEVFVNLGLPSSRPDSVRPRSRGWVDGASSWVIDETGAVVPPDILDHDSYDATYNTSQNDIWRRVPTSTHLILVRTMQGTQETFRVRHLPTDGITDAQRQAIDNIETGGEYMTDAWDIDPIVSEQKKQFVLRLMAHPELLPFIARDGRTWADIYNDLFGSLGLATDKFYDGPRDDFVITPDRSICDRGQSRPIRRVHTPTPDMPELYAYVMDENYGGVHTLAVRAIDEADQI